MTLTIGMSCLTANAAMDRSGFDEPGTAQAYFERGVQRETAGNYAAAEADYNQVIKINPLHESVYNHRGIVRFKIGNLQDAIADYTRAIQMNSNVDHAFNNRALCFYVERNWIGVLNDYASKKALLAPGTPIDYDMLFIYLSQCHMGNKENAKTILKAYLDKRESDGLDDWYLMIANYILGNKTEEELLKNANLAIGNEKTNRLCEAYFYVAANNELEGKLDAAYEAYLNCIDTGVVEFGEYQIAKLEITALLLGVHFKTLPDGLRQFLPLDEGVGLAVSDVTENGPAQAAGIAKSDVIETINGSPATFTYISNLWDQVDKGDKITIGILRKGKNMNIDVNLGVWK